MKDGVDKGFCISYWRLSQRRKFIRTLWLGFLINSVIAFYLFQDDGVPRWWKLWMLVGVISVHLIQTANTYRKWQDEIHGCNDLEKEP